MNCFQVRFLSRSGAGSMPAAAKIFATVVGDDLSKLPISAILCENLGDRFLDTTGWYSMNGVYHGPLGPRRTYWTTIASTATVPGPRLMMLIV